MLRKTILSVLFWTLWILAVCHGLQGYRRKQGICDKIDTPLMLTPLLDKNETEQARQLSLVDKSFLEDFVPQSHAGFFTVDRTLGSHMFFWFFPSPTNSSAPLVLWLNGGPSISSLLGLFHENGPMELEKESTKDRPRYRKRQHSWVGPFSMLYVDNPVGSGFSYSEREYKGNRTMGEEVPQNLYSLFGQFLKVFPEYNDLEIYIGGQSYAGMYVTSFAHYIHTKARLGMTDIRLAGIYLGGPMFDYQRQAPMVSEFHYHVGIIGHKSYMEYKKLAYLLSQDEHTCSKNVISVDEVFTLMFPIAPYNNLGTREIPPYDAVESLMNTLDMKRAVHAGRHRKFHIAGHKLKNRFNTDVLCSRNEKLAVILNNYKVLIFNGDIDSIIPTVSIEAGLLATPWKFQREYNESFRTLWKPLRGPRFGSYSQVGQFCRVVVCGAGHQTPYDQPETVLRIMQDFVTHGCVHPSKNEIATKNDMIEVGKIAKKILRRKISKVKSP